MPNISAELSQVLSRLRSISASDGVIGWKSERGRVNVSTGGRPVLASKCTKEFGVLSRVEQWARLLNRVGVLFVLRRIIIRVDVRNNESLHVLVVERRPVEAPIPLVLLNVLSSIFKIADPLCSVCSQKFADQVARVGFKMAWTVVLAGQDLLVDSKGALVIEWRIPCEHLIDNDTQSPPVYRLIVALALDDLRRKVLGSSTQCPSFVRYLLREPKVSDLQVPKLVKQQILWFKIAIHDWWVLTVQVLQRHDNLSSIEASVVVAEFASLPQVREELATDDILEHHIQIALVLETMKQVDDKRV
mmetsp:Transcript_7297/g.8755  ORF Transcript_7297/g.8755 Transcript_7297/m.8755 type:complete len:303 (+) Transcript_7297:131-1039(+)